jgi:hypothetical protein
MKNIYKHWDTLGAYFSSISGDVAIEARYQKYYKILHSEWCLQIIEYTVKITICMQTNK